MISKLIAIKEQAKRDPIIMTEGYQTRIVSLWNQHRLARLRGSTLRRFDLSVARATLNPLRGTDAFAR